LFHTEIRDLGALGGKYTVIIFHC